MTTIHAKKLRRGELDEHGNPLVEVLAEDLRAGDGSPEHPFRTLRQAVAASGPGDTIVLGPGRWRGSVCVAHPVNLVSERAWAGRPSSIPHETIVEARLHVAPSDAADRLGQQTSARSVFAAGFGMNLRAVELAMPARPARAARPVEVEGTHEEALGERSDRGRRPGLDLRTHETQIDMDAPLPLTGLGEDFEDLFAIEENERAQEDLQAQLAANIDRALEEERANLDFLPEDP
jgi:hypothetical protein